MLFLLLSILYFTLVRPQSKLYFPLNLTCNYQSICYAYIIPPCFIYASPLSLSHSFTTSWLNHTPRVTLLKTEANPPFPTGIPFQAPCPHHLLSLIALSTIQNTSFKTAFSKWACFLSCPLWIKLGL